MTGPRSAGVEAERLVIGTHCLDSSFVCVMQLGGGPIVWFIPFLVFLAACASIQPVAFKGPNGDTVYSMRCNGMGRTLDDCYKKASELCPSGYSIVDRESSVVGMGGIVVPHYRLAIECKS